MILHGSCRDSRRSRRWVTFTLISALALLTIATPPCARAAGPSAFCHTVDGAFTDCTPGAPIEEWSDIPADSFVSGTVFVYADQHPGATMLFLMYDYPLLTAPLGVSECSSVQFDVQELGKIDTYNVQIGTCATGGFDVLVNGVKVPERLEEGILASGGFGPSPNDATPHQMYELGVPLVLVYDPDDPRFWTSGIPIPPLLPGDDFDGDGDLNGDDNCVLQANPDQEDADADGQGDACTLCPGEDSDGDGVADEADNCPSVVNRTQRDHDFDHIGDRCDDCSKGMVIPDCGGEARDTDHDTIANEEDNCAALENVSQDNADADELGDLCDLCPRDPTNTCAGSAQCRTCFADSDTDGTADNEDNCPNASHALQTDTDGDEVGDVCDNCPASPLDDCPVKQDTDTDLVIDEDDNCAGVTNAGQEDEDFDGFGNVCDPCLGDAVNSCLPCTPLAPSPRGVGSGQATAHGAIVTANSDGSTDSEPRSECPSPELCRDDDPKVVYSYVNKKLGALVKCAKAGEDPCDTSKADLIEISSGCRGVADCTIDGALEILLGDNNPNPVEMTDTCARSIVSEGGKFVKKMVRNHSKDRDDLTPDQEVTRKELVASKCLDPVGGAVSLGGACAGLTVRADVIACVFGQLERAEPLPAGPLLP